MQFALFFLQYFFFNSTAWNKWFRQQEQKEWAQSSPIAENK